MNVFVKSETATPVDSKGLIGDAFDTVLYPFTGRDKEYMNKTGAMVLMGTSLFAGSVVGGLITRKRVAAGKDPIFRFLY